jgi:hypothetical protein
MENDLQAKVMMKNIKIIMDKINEVEVKDNHDRLVEVNQA